MAPTHEWKCPACGKWTIDEVRDLPRLRCASCDGQRPDIAEYRKVPAKAVEVPPGGILWKCERCGLPVDTKHNSCPDCFATRPVNAELVIFERRRFPVNPILGTVVGLAGYGLLWWAAGPWAALGAFLLRFGDNLTRGGRP